MLQAVVKALPLLLLEIDESGVIYDYKTEDPSVFHMHPDTYLNRNFQEVLPRKVADELRQALLAIKQGNPPGLVMYSLPMEDGEHWFEARFISSNTNKQTIVIQDVTTYRRNEINLRL